MPCPRRLLSFFLILIFFPVIVGAQQPGVEERWRTLNGELQQSYGSKKWPAALSVLDRMMKLADETKNGEVRAAVFYMEGCVYSLAGQRAPALEALRRAVAEGFTDYGKYSSDTDLDALRGDPEFQALLAEIKARYGPAPLEWDRDKPAPSFTIKYDNPKDPRFPEMRREFVIDAVVEGAKDNYERLRRLARWVSTRWEHSPDHMASKSDPITILREAQKGGRFICREYAIVMAGVASAYAMPARVVNLLPRDVETRSEAHSVAEVWLEQFHKWVLADGQYGAIGELDGVPLNAIELQAAFAADKPVTCVAGEGVCTEWKPFILRNAFYFKVYGDQRSFQRAASEQLVLIPKGAPEPHTFAGDPSVFAGSVYTSNPATFYAPPPRLPEP
jgi:hypothetical protein